MTDQQKKESLSKHADAIKAAIEAAIDDGLNVAFEIYYDLEGAVESVSFDLDYRGKVDGRERILDWVSLWSEEY